MDTYKVYVLTDETGNITSVNSSIFLSNLIGWTQIDEGTGDRCYHAQGNYFDKLITTQKGVYRYKMVDGVPMEKAVEEITQEEAALPTPPLTADEKATNIDNAFTDFLINVLPIMLGA